uniref:Tr-type G domain-containing protein n=1 Tax=Odontella aurita TaxID=265563 RepID=A0A7S4JKP7_9STRA
MVDCPGHTDFHDETVASLKAVDGAVLAVDAVEGIMMSTTMAASAAISEGLPLCLLVTKVDRLIVELKLPPDDAYYKLRRIVEEVNMLIRQKSNGRYPPLSPERGNVAFSSGMHGWSFTLGSIAERYVEHCRSSSEREALAEEDERGGGGDDGYGYSDDEDDYGYGGGGGGNGGGMSGTPLGRNLTPADLARRLWGDCYLDPAAGTFHRSSRDCDNSEGPVKRTFVQYALEPLYKIYAACLGENERDVDKMLRTVGVILGRDQLRASARPLLRAALRRFFGDGSGGFVDMVAKHIPSPAAASKGKVARCYTGPLTSPVASSMSTCSPTGPLMFHVTKLYAAPDGKSFSSFGRIYSGTVKPGDRVRVLGEGYDPDVDDEDCATATVSGVRVPRGRRNVEVTRAVAGNWVLLEGVDANIVKTATITSLGSSMDDMGARNNDDDSARIFAPLKFPNVGHESTLKLAVEPLHPSDLPKMVEGLRRVSKSYPLARTRVEESGEHVLFGTGELYLDCAMSDLRTVYSDVEVKVADPVVGFRETVAETSGIKCFAETANKRNRLTVIAEPLDEGLAEKLECGKVKLDKWDKKKVGRYFQSQFDWDLLSARSVWAFGPSPSDGTNVLLDDTLPSEVDKSLLGSCRGGIVQGFQWATREGPLCEEPVRSTKIKILDATLADKPIHRGGGQIIPAARRAVHSGLLTATPRLLEPWYRFQIQCVPELVGEMESLLKKRRGHVTGDRPIPGTTLSLVHGYLPVLDGFGFETDVRCLTQGQAFAHTVFDHWGVVPGDPLDSSVVLHPLEPSPPHCLAREFLVKTRRRKGLSEDVTVSKFFDEGMRAQLEAEEGDGLDDNLSVG